MIHPSHLLPGKRVNRRRFLRNSLATGWSASLLGNSLDAWAAEKGTMEADLVAAISRARLSMLFRGKTIQECRAWQKKFRAKLNALLGPSKPPGQWDVVEEERAELDDHTRYSLLLRAKGVPSLPVYLLVPKGLAKGEKIPGVMCVHGHGKYGNDSIVGRRDLPGVAEEIKKYHYDYGLKFVRRGYVVVAPCMIPFGRRLDRVAYGKKDPCGVTFVRMQALGKILITENLRDLRWALSLLQSRAEVLPERLGCAGLSYGGRMTMMVSAIDERIGVACVSGALNLLQERAQQSHYGCGSQIVPGLLQYGDFPEIGALIAPRPCVWETGSTDVGVVPVWDEIFRDRLRRVYRALGAGDQLHFDRFEGGHWWNGEKSFPLFDEVLKS